MVLEEHAHLLQQVEASVVANMFTLVGQIEFKTKEAMKVSCSLVQATNAQVTLVLLSWRHVVSCASSTATGQAA
jgi:hypothetical protein